jgi:hypothetical protein
VRFAAFISYRHVELDKLWATWLHKKLETYRVPKGITTPQVGNRRIGRVFRDDEELAASSDLSTSIRDALKQSEYLIVVCTPDAAKSRYVNQEIREFASLGRADKILALLVNGEPENAFPPALKELAREPLAADVRSDTPAIRKKAGLRILAAILNCTFDQLRQRERLRIRRRIELAALAIIACSVLVLTIRYGVYRLSLENTSIGTYDLVVRHGLSFMEPMLGSKHPYIEPSDKLYEVSPQGRAAFPSGTSVYFPAYSRRPLFRWLNGYFLEELKQADNKKAPASEFFLEQVQVDNQAGEAELLKAIRIGAPAAYEVVLAHHLSRETVRTALLSALGNPEPKTKALLLNALRELYGDDSWHRDLTKQVLGTCDSAAVKVAMALSYKPSEGLLTQCVSSLIASKHWKDAASLAVRFQLPSTAVLPWLTDALDSSTPDEFLAAADVVMGLNINDPHTITSLRKRLADSNQSISTGAAMTLWCLGDDGDLVQKRLHEMIVANDKQPLPVYYLAFLRSPLSDDEVIQSAVKQLVSVGAGDFTGGWLVSGPDALDILTKFKARSNVDVCLAAEKRTRPADYEQAILTARSIILGCRENSAVDALDSYVRTGVPGLLGVMMDPRISEAYGSMLAEGKGESFESGLNRLWNLLQSQRSESSANYRLAVQYGIARLVVNATSESEYRKRYFAVMQKARTWENDEAPHHRAAYANMSRVVREAIDRKRLLLLRTQF